LRVSWTTRRSNQSILKEISPEYSLEELMLKLKLQYFGYHAHTELGWSWGENIQLYFVQSQNIQSGRNHSSGSLQHPITMKRKRTLRDGLILALKSPVLGSPLDLGMVG